MPHGSRSFAAMKPLLCLAAIVATPCAAAPPAAPSATADRATPVAESLLEAMTRRATARIAAADASPEVTGSGPYPAAMEVDLALPNATIYRPADLGRMGSRRLAVLIWGNGACSNEGASARAHLAEIASHGYLVIAPGRPLTGPLASPGAPMPKEMTTTLQDLRLLLDWALAENGRRGSPYRDRIDPAAVAVAGHSCGGIQAIMLADDPRVKTVIVHNSGIVPVLPDNPPLVTHAERLAGLRESVLYVSGGPSDILWSVTNRTFDATDGIPAALVSSDVGHGGTFAQPHGGRAARIALDWLQWRPRGDATGARSFVGADCGLCHDPDWTIRKRAIR